MDYRDVLATVVGASVAGIVAFFIRLAFPVNAAVLALIYAATYSLLWSIVGDHSRQLFHKHLPASTRFDGHWRLVTGGLALAAALCAGLIVAFALSRSTIGNSSTAASTTVVTRTLALQQRVVVTRKTIVLPVKTTIVTTPVREQTITRGGNQGTSTVYSHTVVVVRPPVTVTVSSTRSRTSTVTQTTPTVTAPVVTTVVTTAPPATDTAPTTDTTATAPATTTTPPPTQ
ncbi:MAG: hypothetical protein ABI317_15270 [Gaiellales bacterium]